ncbi:hypothetical protein P3W45_000031 [Vairimorpha bombi]|jgi:hypothetical protein
MEQKLKTKINELKDRIKDNDAILEYIEETNTCNDNCLVGWYNTMINTEASDLSEELYFTSVRDIDDNNIIDECLKDHRHFSVNILNNLEVLNVDDTTNIEIDKIEKHKFNFYTFSKKYLEFVKCINFTTERKSITNFDLDIFYTIFNEDYTDETIKAFLDKLAQDPLNYSGNGKQFCIIILVYAYLYAINIKFSKKCLLYEKVKNNIFLLKSDTKFKISYTKEYNIDKYLLNVKEFENFYDESTFLNFYYQTYLSKTNVEREIFVQFCNRLNKNILEIDKKYLLSFIRRIFLLHTILYSSLDDFQVYKMVIDFFNKKISKFKSDNITKNILKLYISMVNKIGDTNLYNLIISYIRHNIEYSDRYEGIIFKFKLFSIRSWNDYLDLVYESTESYNNLSLALDLLYYCTKNINKNAVLDIVNVYLSIYNKIKLEHLFKFVKNFFGNMKYSLKLLLANIQDNESVLDFYNTNSDIFSKLVLSLQRYTVIVTEEVKKKKKSNLNNTSADTLFFSFVGILYKIEDQLVKFYGVDKVKLLKQRSFKFKKVEKN